MCVTLVTLVFNKSFSGNLFVLNYGEEVVFYIGTFKKQSVTETLLCKYDFYWV
nr:MAG TPA: hypothetical protein [Caudoviricetes sp.]